MPRQHRPHGAHASAYIRPEADWLDFERAPNVPTIEEIEVADELRHDLELKYLGKADPWRRCGTSDSGWETGEDD